MTHFDPAMNRRSLLKLGAAGGTAAAIASLPAPAQAASWPTAQLPASAAQFIDPSQFMSKAQLAAYGEEANALGLRATGATNTEGFIRSYAKRFAQAGLKDIKLEPVPLRQWLADSWSLEIDGQTIPDTFYVPYTRPTGAAGVTAEMVYVPLGEILDVDVPRLEQVISTVNVQGKIAVFEVPYQNLPAATFAALGYPGGVYFPPGDNRLTATYLRPWLNHIVPILDLLAQAGAAATIGIWPDLPGKWARQYTPYDAVFRPIPGLWADSIQGAHLKQLASNSATATVKLQATIKDVLTHNLIGFIPGTSDELTVLHTHTDGTNGMEENGPIGILATAQYLARLPRTSLERTVMVFLSTGHFAGGLGIRHFLQQHEADLVPRITSILTLEHLGCLEWLPTPEGNIRPTGLTELGAYFAPNSQGLVRASKAAMMQTAIAGTVSRPFLPAPTDVEQFGTPKQPIGWPGEGTYFYWYGDLLTTNFITGPYGLDHRRFGHHRNGRLRTPAHKGHGGSENDSAACFHQQTELGLPYLL